MADWAGRAHISRRVPGNGLKMLRTLPTGGAEESTVRLGVTPRPPTLDPSTSLRMTLGEFLAVFGRDWAATARLDTASVLAAGAVVCGAASEFARSDRSGAGRAWSAALAGETHTPVIGVDDVRRAALVGICDDEADCLIEDDQAGPREGVPAGSARSGAPGGRARCRTGVVPIGVYVATPASIDCSRSSGLMADLRPAIRSNEHLAGERGVDGVGPPAGQFVLGIGENGIGPTAHVVEFDAPPVIEREGVTRTAWGWSSGPSMTSRPVMPMCRPRMPRSNGRNSCFP